MARAWSEQQKRGMGQGWGYVVLADTAAPVVVWVLCVSWDAGEHSKVSSGRGRRGKVR
jgi:hypothetical protein